MPTHGHGAAASGGHASGVLACWRAATRGMRPLRCMGASLGVRAVACAACVRVASFRLEKEASTPSIKSKFRSSASAMRPGRVGNVRLSGVRSACWCAARAAMTPRAGPLQRVAVSCQQPS